MARVGPLLAMGWRNVAALQACLVMGVALLRPVTAASSGVNPLEKTVELMTALMGAVIADGEKEQAAYSKFADWCKGTSLEKQAKIKSATKQRSKLEATLQLAHAQHEGATVLIDELSGLISNSDERLKEATVARAKEAAVFKEVEGKLMESLDALGRAVETLEKESQASSAALVQTTVDTQSLQEVLLGLGSVIDAVGSFTRGGNNETAGSPGGKLVALLESAEEQARRHVPAQQQDGASGLLRQDGSHPLLQAACRHIRRQEGPGLLLPALEHLGGAEPGALEAPALHQGHLGGHAGRTAQRLPRLGRRCLRCKP
mmetsp:Transcript_23333/g.61466  ORF Transcript_23333/g.61466 Transcript_23333/m.61466 type:complete len:317 (-) Transcript_23333:97-1047(-)